jgi:hypothetical protein
MTKMKNLYFKKNNLKLNQYQLEIYIKLIFLS